MAILDWIDKQDGVDEILAKDINEIARIINLLDNNKLDKANLPKLYIRYSKNADGTDFSEEWSIDKHYVGFALSDVVPIDKKKYVWISTPSKEYVDGEINNNNSQIRIILNELAKNIESNSQEILANSKRITNIESDLYDEAFEIDGNVAYRKNVPSDALPYAEIQKIGGKTIKSPNLVPLDNIYPVENKNYNTGEVTIASGDNYWLDFKTIPLSVGTYSYAIRTKDGSVVEDFPPVGSFEGTFTVTTDGEEKVIDVMASNPLDNRTLYVMCWEGSTIPTIEDFVPYGVLENVKVTELRSEGANLFDGSLVQVGSSFGITVTYDAATQVFTLNGTSTKTESFCISYLNLTGEKGKKYTVKTEVVGGSATNLEGKYAVVFFDAADTINSGGNYLSTNIAVSSVKSDTLQRQYITRARFYITEGVTLNNLQVKVMLARADSDIPYQPYSAEPIDTFAVPEEIQNIEGFGQSNPDNAEEYNYIDCVRDKFVAVGHLVDGVWVSYETAEEIDISLKGAFIKVQAGGSIVAVNKKEEAIPFTVEYQKEIA